MTPSLPRFRRISLLSLTFTLAAALPAALAQNNADGLGQTLAADAAVKAALAQVQANEPKLLEEQIRLCEIPAPPFKEQKRGEAYRDLFKSLGLRNVRIDAVGNVLGERPGQGGEASPRVHRAPRHGLPRGDQRQGDA